MTLDSRVEAALRLATPVNKSELRDFAYVLQRCANDALVADVEAQSNGLSSQDRANVRAVRSMIERYLSPEEASRLLEFARKGVLQKQRTMTMPVKPLSATIGRAREGTSVVPVPRAALTEIKAALVSCASSLPVQYRQPLTDLAQRVTTLNR